MSSLRNVSSWIACCLLKIDESDDFEIFCLSDALSVKLSNIFDPMDLIIGDSSDNLSHDFLLELRIGLLLLSSSRCFLTRCVKNSLGSLSVKFMKSYTRGSFSSLGSISSLIGASESLLAYSRYFLLGCYGLVLQQVIESQNFLKNDEVFCCWSSFRFRIVHPICTVVSTSGLSLIGS